MTTELYSKSDRIQKAFQIFVEGRIVPVDRGLWHCEAQAGDLYYEVTTTTCTCPDFLNRHVVCKHMLACEGIRVVLALREMRSAESVEGLREIAKKYSAAIRAAEFRFRKVARDEYKALRERICRRGVSLDKAALGASLRNQPYRHTYYVTHTSGNREEGR